MRRLLPSLFALLAASATAQVPSAQMILEGGFDQASTAVAAQPARTSANIDKCWRRAWDERLDFTGMPLTVCVDRVEFEVPRDGAGGLRIEGARMTAFGLAAHPGGVKENGSKPFSLPLADRTAVFGRKTGSGWRVSAHIFVTDTRVGEDALVILNMNLDHAGRMEAGSAALEAYTTCPQERCFDRYDETKVEFVAARPDKLTISEKLMACWQRPRGARTEADEVNMTRTVCVNTIDLELRSNRDGDLIAHGAGMALSAGDKTMSTASGFGQMAYSYGNPPRFFRIEAQPLSARRAPNGYRAEIILESSAADAEGRSYNTVLVLDLGRDGKIAGSAVYGVVSCVDYHACGGMVGDTLKLDFVRD